MGFLLKFNRLTISEEKIIIRGFKKSFLSRTILPFKIVGELIIKFKRRGIYVKQFRHNPEN
jgi:hypothetical protein